MQIGISEVFRVIISANLTKKFAILKKETIYAKVYDNKVFKLDYIMHKVKTADKQFRHLIFSKTF